MIGTVREELGAAQCDVGIESEDCTAVAVQCLIRATVRQLYSFDRERRIGLHVEDAIELMGVDRRSKRVEAVDRQRARRVVAESRDGEVVRSRRRRCAEVEFGPRSHNIKTEHGIRGVDIQLREFQFAVLFETHEPRCVAFRRGQYEATIAEQCEAARLMARSIRTDEHVAEFCVLRAAAVEQHNSEVVGEMSRNEEAAVGPFDDRRRARRSVVEVNRREAA